MALNGKAIKQRMKSITNTKKITKAMEMVSAAKMRRAVEAAIRTRSYAVLAKEFLQRLSGGDAQKIPLLENRPISRALVIYISSNRGLCGSFNSNLFRTVGQKLKSHPELHNVQIDMIGVGKKSALFAKKNSLNLVALFDSMSDRPSFRDVTPISKMFMDGFLQKTYDRVFLAYTEYRSSVVQNPVIKQLLPVTEEQIDAMLATIPTQQEVAQAGITEDQYVFEPSAEQILTTVLPQLVEVQSYQALLESLASEHSARMVAMKNASDAAGDMLSNLRLSFNKARQAAITQEISEIVGGAAALE